jgi:Rieske Fe-S protein
MTPTRREVVVTGARLVPAAVLAPGLLAASLPLAGCGGGGAGTAQAGGPGQTPPPPEGGPGAPGDGVAVGRLEELPPGSGQAALYRGTPIVLLNVEGDVRIFSAICTHEGCTVDWSPTAGILQCPCHDGRFAVDGSVIEGPPPAPLLRLEAGVRDGTIYVLEGDR